MDPHLYTGILLIAALLFGGAFLITSWRILVGPNSLDRLLGLDGLVAMVQCALATYMCFSLDLTVTAAMLVVALLGFISSISVARFRKKDGQ